MNTTPKTKPPEKSESKTKSQPKRKAKLVKKPPLVRVQRHWFGLMSLYGLMCLGLALVFVFILPKFGTFWSGNILTVAIAISFLIVIIYVLFILINKVYRGNVLMINQTEVRQITQQTLFFTKTSVLGLANIEDVTAIRKGVFAHLLDYGTLNIETAGEQENFKFKYCPDPDRFVGLLMQAREKYLVESNQDQVLR